MTSEGEKAKCPVLTGFVNEIHFYDGVFSTYCKSQEIAQAKRTKRLIVLEMEKACEITDHLQLLRRQNLAAELNLDYVGEIYEERYAFGQAKGKYSEPVYSIVDTESRRIIHQFPPEFRGSKPIINGKTWIAKSTGGYEDSDGSYAQSWSYTLVDMMGEPVLKSDFSHVEQSEACERVTYLAFGRLLGEQGVEQYGYHYLDADGVPMHTGYSNATPFSHGYTLREVRNGGLIFLDDEYGKVVSTFDIGKIDRIEYSALGFNSKLAMIMNVTRNELSIYDFSGKKVKRTARIKNFAQENLSPRKSVSDEGLFFATVFRGENYETYFFDKFGHKKLGPFDMAHDFHEGVALIHNWGRYYFINSAGKEVLSLISAIDAGDYHNGIALVKYNKFSRFIDWTGHILFDRSFKEAAEFKEGVALVTELNGLKHYIDQKGKAVFEKGAEI
ncbi:MAG: hypothetical protein NTW50_05365 [Candidatus Berkelbacteria bacterium]|nr:hypothetical protein [Candidatus Berkelbacteria bacterium]